MTDGYTTVDTLHGRIYMSAKEVQEGFFCKRGRSISRSTLDLWEGEGMEVLRRKGRKWYRWVECWAWFEKGQHADPNLDNAS